ncbi:MAG: hypothetical protein MUD10_00780 [Candidatus Pacebacteria bacterium]|jgi:hypothetical protein|nr:hypothetical protein [Candidatus Paceibacterota bacterium]
MADTKPTLPETPEPIVEQSQKTEISSDKYEKIEKEAEAESKQEENLIDELAELRAKVSASKQAAANSGQQTQLDDDIEARKKKIVDSFLKAALAANFAEDKVGHIMHIAERYIKKDYPDIADEIHDRIIDERDK